MCLWVVLPASAGMIPGPQGIQGIQGPRGEVLPASAGMIPNFPQKGLCLFRAPRIRGDDPRTTLKVLLLMECSPHPRG